MHPSPPSPSCAGPPEDTIHQGTLPRTTGSVQILLMPCTPHPATTCIYFTYPRHPTLPSHCRHRCRRSCPAAASTDTACPWFPSTAIYCAPPQVATTLQEIKPRTSDSEQILLTPPPCPKAFCDHNPSEPACIDLTNITVSKHSPQQAESQCRWTERKSNSDTIAGCKC